MVGGACFPAPAQSPNIQAPWGGTTSSKQAQVEGPAHLLLAADFERVCFVGAVIKTGTGHSSH